MSSTTQVRLFGPVSLTRIGFELFTDLLLADWLLLRGYASTVRFHGKAIPWFISDTTHHDFHWMISQCAAHPKSEMQKFGLRLKSYLDDGKFIFSAHPFWTTPYPYWHLLEIAPDLHDDLVKSSLVIFKGDLNYRKLVYDCNWPVETSFSHAIGPLASSGPEWSASPPFPSVLTLRTAKSDPVVGLEGGVAATSTLDLVDKEWRINGKYALIQFHASNKK